MIRLKWKKWILTLISCALLNFIIFYFNHEKEDGQEAPYNDNIHGRKKETVSKHPITTAHWQDPYDSDDVERRHFYSLQEAYNFMRTTDIKVSPRIIIHYKPYKKKMPNFADDSDKDIFLQSFRNRQYLDQTHPSELRGVIDVIKNGTFQMDYTCGHRSDYDYVKRYRKPTKYKSFDILVPLIVPMAYLFQHFFDGTLPKLIQAYEFIRQPHVKILLERPNHNNVFQLLDFIGIHPNQIVWHQRDDTRTVYHAQYMLMICIAPPLSKELWHAMRHTMQIPHSLQVSERNAYVVLLTREGAKLGGRNMLNQREVEDYLRRRYADNFYIFRGNLALKEAMKMFSNVKIMIGTHGGAFYNLNYASQNTSVIEFGPVLKFGREIDSLPHAIFWAMSNVIGQDYWRVQCISQNHQHDMNVDLEKLEKILDVVDKNIRMAT